MLSKRRYCSLIFVMALYLWISTKQKKRERHSHWCRGAEWLARKRKGLRRLNLEAVLWNTCKVYRSRLEGARSRADIHFCSLWGRPYASFSRSAVANLVWLPGKTCAMAYIRSGLWAWMCNAPLSIVPYLGQQACFSRVDPVRLHAN